MWKLKQCQGTGSPEADLRHASGVEVISGNPAGGRGGREGKAAMKRCSIKRVTPCRHITGAQPHWGTLGVSIAQAPQSDAFSVYPEVDCLHSNSHQSLASQEVDPLARTAGLSGHSGFWVLRKVLRQAEMAQLAQQW